MALMARKTEFSAIVRCRPDFMPVGRALAPAKLVESLSDEQVGQADVCLRFDRDRAWQVGRKSQKHITESYGVMLGAAAVTVPVLGEALPLPDGPEVLWLPRHASDWRPDTVWPHAAEFLAEIPSADVLEPEIEPEAAWRAISGASLCIGIAGGLTAMACALGKPLIEVMPPKLFHANWVAKWGMPDYRILTVDVEDLTVEQMMKSAVGLAGEIQARRLPWESRQAISRST